MIWIMPMAGKGTRTQALGEFKPFIEINGHKIFSWFISSIKNLISEDDLLVLITRPDFFERFSFKEEIGRIFNFFSLRNRVQFVVADGEPKGPSDTVLRARNLIFIDKPVTVINPDQYIDFDLPADIRKNTGYLGLCLCFGDETGFVQIENGLVTKFVERKNISNIASSGVFISASGKDLIKSIEKQMAREEILDGEYYLGPSFNYLIESGYKIHPLPVRCKYDLGNISGIQLFSKRNFVCR